MGARTNWNHETNLPLSRQTYHCTLYANAGPKRLKLLCNLDGQFSATRIERQDCNLTGNVQLMDQDSLHKVSERPPLIGG